MDRSRRRFLKDSGLGIVVATIAGPQLLLTPAEARTRNMPLKTLTEVEVVLLESVADVLLPGSAEAGLAWFIDDQLAKDPNDCLLIARYFQVAPPYEQFYRGGLQAIDSYAHHAHGVSFVNLEQALQAELIGSLFPGQPDGWKGPPSPVVYLCLRNDVVDVMYGTVEGFEKLAIPYLPHIEPPEKW